MESGNLGARRNPAAWWESLGDPGASLIPVKQVCTALRQSVNFDSRHLRQGIRVPITR
jgi:hypothetical protein